MRISTLLKPLSFIPALLLMYMIFSFSDQDAQLSSSISYKASYMIVRSVDYIFDTGLEEYQISDYAYRINGITRKLAHMTEYFLLAVAVSFPLYVYGLRGILLVLVVGTVCVGFACSDEYHQSFVAGRAASKKDVAIDSFGILIGILLVRIIGWTGRHTIFRPAPEKDASRMTARQIRRLKKEQKRLEKEQRKNEERYYKERIHSAKEEREARIREKRGSVGRDAEPDQSDHSNWPTRVYEKSPVDEPRILPAQDRPRKPEVSSDELSDDMPFSRLFHPGRK